VTNFDLEADIVVVGFGGAGSAAAITAADGGARVILLDKAPAHAVGGNTRVASQGYLNPTDPETAATYLKALCGPFEVPSSMIEVWAQENCKNNEWLASIDGDPQEHQPPPAGIEYPDLPGAECVRKYHHGDVLGYSKTWEFLEESVKSRPQIEILYETPATELIQLADGAIGGVIATQIGQNGENNKTIRIKAKRGVILTTGGFENNQDMIRNYLPGVPFCYTSGSPYNEGDGIRMAMQAGADLWHMNNYAGPSMAFKAPEYPTTFSIIALHFSHEPPGGMIVVGGDGKRFINEKYKHKHGKIPMGDQWAPMPVRTPMYMIFDQTLLDAGPLYDSKPNRGWTPIMIGYDWSKDNRKEIENGWIKQAANVQALAAELSMDATALSASIGQWNASISQGNDAAFGRTKSLNAMADGPLFALPLVPSMLNTQGGPRRNERAEILRPDGQPIKRLYSAGEMGSIFGYLYQGTGNIGECFAFGRIAAHEALALTPWSDTAVINTVK